MERMLFPSGMGSDKSQHIRFNHPHQQYRPRNRLYISSLNYRKAYKYYKRIISANASSGDGLSVFEQREAGLKLQLEDLKREAIETHKSILESAQNASRTSGRLSSTSETDATASLRQRIETAVQSMSEGLVERDTEVRLLLLAALAGEHILYIGPPGTAKSELGRRLSKLCQGQYFERLLTRFSVPEELFGPLSMRALEEDKYIRQTHGYLPEAKVAFIDEIFKANSAILNTLLTILNERLFDNGSKREKVPLLCLVGASNELPESEELDALYDRFLIRRQVNQVSPSGLLEMLSGNNSAGRRQAALLGHPGQVDSSTDEDESTEGQLDTMKLNSVATSTALLTDGDFENTRKTAEAIVEVPPSVLNLLADVRSFLQDKCEPPVYVSDRRLVKAVGLMQVAAYTSGRNRLIDYDCLLLRHILWQRPEESERIYDWLLNALAADDGMQQMQYLLAGMFGRACRSLNDASAVETVAKEVGTLRSALEEKLIGMCALLMNASGEGGSAGSGLDTLWLGKEETDAVATALIPKIEKTKEEVEKLLFEVVTLEIALIKGAGAVDLAQLLPQQWAAFLR